MTAIHGAARARGRWPAVGAILVAVLSGWSMWPGPAPVTTAPALMQPAAPAAAAPDALPTTSAPGARSRPVTTTVDTVPGVAPIADLEARLASSSLAGTEVDGAVRFDGDGRVLPDLDLRRRFDWYLALIGEFAAAEIRALFAAHLVREHGAASAQRVLDLFDRYVGYLAAVAAASPGRTLDAAARLDSLADARARHLGADLHTAFYAAEEAYARHTLARLAVARDPALDADQRARRLAELGSALPADQRRAIDDAGTAALVAELDAVHAASGADEATRHAGRSALWGAAAAQRLAELDRVEAAWQSRIDAYLAARRAIEADATLDAAARAANIDALRRARFDEAEQRRIASLEAVGALASSDD